MNTLVIYYSLNTSADVLLSFPILPSQRTIAIVSSPDYYIVTVELNQYANVTTYQQEYLEQNIQVEAWNIINSYV